MATVWQLQDAKSRFSRVVEDALREGPQTVTRRGEPVVVVVSIETWRRLCATRGTLKTTLRSCPVEDLDLTREAEERRQVALP